MPRKKEHDAESLLRATRQLLGKTQAEFAPLMGSGSARTVRRWESGRTTITPQMLWTAINLLGPTHPQYRIALTNRLNELLRALGQDASHLVPPPPTHIPVAVVDAVLLAAASPLGVSPEVVQDALLAALLEIERAGIDVRSLRLALQRRRSTQE